MKYSSVTPILLLFLLLVLGPKATPAQAQTEPPIPSTSAVTPAASAENQDATDYSLAPNDVVEIKVFQENDLDCSLRISKEGTVTFPLIGSVEIAGKTPQAAALLIKDKLAKDYLVNPQVNITVVQYARRLFTVLGQVQRPGSYELPDRESLTLIQAIGMAGGYTRIADPGKITLKRTVDGRQSIMHLDAKKMAARETESGVPIRPGDIITIGESIF